MYNLRFIWFAFYHAVYFDDGNDDVGYEFADTLGSEDALQNLELPSVSCLLNFCHAVSLYKCKYKLVLTTAKRSALCFG